MLGMVLQYIFLIQQILPMASEAMLCGLDKNWKSGKMRVEAPRKEVTNPCLCGSTSSPEIPWGSPTVVCHHLPCGFGKTGVFPS